MKKTFPLLYGQASNGKVKTWKIWVEGNKDGTATVLTDHGYEDGETQRATLTITSGKNIGRSNETTPFEQACSEAEAKWNKKRDKKYFPNKSDFKKDYKPLPMLAHDFKKRGHSIEWPAYVQPKLNGIRCLATRTSQFEIEYTSRGGKDFTTLEHLTPHLLKVMKVDEVFDGELFTKQLTFQEITSAVKRQQEITSMVEYWIYDTVQDEPFSDRTKRLHEARLQHPLILVPTLTAKNEDQMKKLHQQMVEADYEGTIVRNYHGVYKVNHRSADLQKYKDFIDEEFEIVGGKQGTGKDENTVIFFCETEEGKRFDCRPRGTFEQRHKWWSDLRNLLGKQLTVRYQTRSDDNIPIFPVGISIREGVIDKDGSFKPDL